MVKIALAHTSPAQSARAPDAPASSSNEQPAAPVDRAPVGGGAAVANEVDPKPAAPPDLTLVESADPVITALIPAARSAAVSLEAQGRRVSRNALADVLRAEGYPVSNARASTLLKTLKAERGSDLPVRRGRTTLPRVDSGSGAVAEEAHDVPFDDANVDTHRQPSLVTPGLPTEATVTL
jgi:hypothetical protein